MKIAFGVFDWGLGHATRSTPLIRALLNQGHKVHIISTGRAINLLKKNFKDKCIFHDSESLYSVYNNKTSFKIGFAFSIPFLIKSLITSRNKSKKIIKKEKFDKIISDCRFDVYDKKNNSYLINHQLRFKTPFGMKNIFEIWLAFAMRKFKYILVPDFPGENNLSGILSHSLNYITKKKIKYIGILSHIKKIKTKETLDYFISLSGPEITRIELEKIILSQIKSIKGKIVIAGGRPESNSKNYNRNLQFHSFLNQKEQEKFMNKAKFIIIRAGYTTIMELVELGKKALLIPSPGQTEQEYLTNYCEKNQYFNGANQNKLNLKKDIETSKTFKGFSAPWKTEQSVKNFLKLINE